MIVTKPFAAIAARHKATTTAIDAALNSKKTTANDAYEAQAGTPGYGWGRYGYPAQYGYGAGNSGMTGNLLTTGGLASTTTH
jgi:hypothetical protein